MYTQCPECQIAFRVTARVLQQAGGKVRCGGCGNAFSALDHLSEEMPASSPPPATTGEPAPDILAETSRQLLETLDELAGPDDVRIEDTGIEWRVLDDADAAIAENNLTDPSDTGSMRLDNEGDAGSAEQESLNLQGIDKAPQERRYDDNTPLPDDFEDEEVVAYAPPQPQRRETDQIEEDSQFDEVQGDLALSEPDDWTDLLDEVDSADAIPLEVEEELAAIHSQLSTRDARNVADVEPPLITDDVVPDQSDPVPIDLDAKFELQAEALGITGTQEVLEQNEATAPEDDLTDEVPLLRGSLDEFEDTREGSEASVIELSAEDEDTEGDWEASVGERLSDDEDEETPAAIDDTSHADGDLEVGDEIVLADDEAIDEDSEFRSNDEEEPQSLETDAAEENAEDPDDEIPDEYEWVASADDATGEFEQPVDDDALALIGDDDTVDDVDFDDASDSDHAALLQPDDTEGHDLRDDVEQIAADDIDDPVINIDFRHSRHEDERDDEDRGDSADADADKPPSDDDLAATVFGADHASKFFDENSGEVETIIMEGEFVRGAIEKESVAAEQVAHARMNEASKLADTYALNRNKLRGGRRSYDPPSIVIVIGIVALAVTLLAQFVHASRDMLATSDLFNQTVAPIYRILGQPITPEWNIKGWRFESTNGSTDENEEVLTVVSRIANNSETPLPYPLVHVSLTDRWEEIIGSRVLEPNEYLAGDLDPNKPVTPGENFTAVIAIENPSEEATGFKLNVCYRVVPGRVRCALEDFKD
jgi:predicted Zn finger-like uncharacterized protein